MRDHLPQLFADAKLNFSVVAFVGNFVAGITFDEAYKGLLFVLAAVNLVWAILNIRKLRREERKSRGT